MAQPVHFERDFLYQELVTFGKTHKLVCEEQQVSDKTLRKIIDGYDLWPFIKTSSKYIGRHLLTREFLTKELVDNRKTMCLIAAENSISRVVVRKYAKIYGLKSMARGRPSQLLTNELLLDMYVEKQMSVLDITKKLRIRSKYIVLNALKRFGILTREEYHSTADHAMHRANWKGCGEVDGSYWSQVKAGAKNRNFEFAVTVEYAAQLWVDQNKRCALSGVELTMATKRDLDLGLAERTASFDRIDSSIGYVPGNCQWIHKELQNMKGNMLEPKLFEWCNRIVAHQKELAI